jgi:hypothetical protein
MTDVTPDYGGTPLVRAVRSRATRRRRTPARRIRGSRPLPRQGLRTEATNARREAGAGHTRCMSVRRQEFRASALLEDLSQAASSLVPCSGRSSTINVGSWPASSSRMATTRSALPAARWIVCPGRQSGTAALNVGGSAGVPSWCSSLKANHPTVPPSRRLGPDGSG